MAAFERGLSRRFLGPDERELMRARIAELSASRAGIVAAVDAEHRRIERNPHDGLQQRLVALGMLLGRARRTESRDLLRQAHEGRRPDHRDRGAAVRVILAEEALCHRPSLHPFQGRRLPAQDRVVQVQEFLDALERVGSSGAAFDPEVVRQLLARTTHVHPLNDLTARERDVLAQMAQGHTDTAIAGRLHVSRSAVEKHINAIFDKLRLPRDGGYSRRVLAILRYLGS